MGDEEPSASRSIFEWLGENVSSHCGYCKTNAPDKFTHGMWAHSLTAADYQALMDRGWRRSGSYCYKPQMWRTCCPQYTIRTDTSDPLRLSASQKRVVARLNRYLKDGTRPRGKETSKKVVTPTHSRESAIKKDKARKLLSDKAEGYAQGEQSVPRSKRDRPVLSRRERRRERKLAALAAQSLGEESLRFRRRSPPPAKTIEQRLAFPDNAKHRLELRLLWASDDCEEWKRTLAAAHKVYQAYQVKIHKDPPTKVGLRQFRNFLADSPIEKVASTAEGHPGFGSFHCQYWLDEKLIAVGVLDLLSDSISSVYLFYDPDYHFLSLGTYTALQEMALTRSLAALEPSQKFYYMGYYIHSCPKMRYKGDFGSPFLACPETYVWRPLSEARPLLDQAKYSRLNPEAGAVDTGVGKAAETLILYQGQAMDFRLARMLQVPIDEAKVADYARLAGKEVATRALVAIS